MEFNCVYACEKSNSVNVSPLANLNVISSIFGIGYLFNSISLLIMILKSPQILTDRFSLTLAQLGSPSLNALPSLQYHKTLTCQVHAQFFSLIAYGRTIALQYLGLISLTLIFTVLSFSKPLVPNAESNQPNFYLENVDLNLICLPFQ